MDVRLCVAIVGFGLVMLNFAVDEVTNPRLGAERRWAARVRAFGRRPGLSTPVLRD